MKNEITYTEINGINYPNLALPEQPKVNIGKYGQIRLGFIKKHRRGTYTTLLTEGRLNEHLHTIDEQAHEQINLYIKQMAEQTDVIEELMKKTLAEKIYDDVRSCEWFQKLEMKTAAL